MWKALRRPFAQAARSISLTELNAAPGQLVNTDVRERLVQRLLRDAMTVDGVSSQGSAAPVHVSGVSVARVAANCPASEDRAALDIDRGLFAVIDGHGGDAAAEFCAETLLANVARHASEGGGGASMADALVEAFEETDRQFAERYWRVEGGRLPSGGMSGACVAAVHVGDDGVVTVANAGDCRVLCVSVSEASREVSVRQLSNDHDVSNPRERERILESHDASEAALFGSEDDPRVKGILQPSRGIGDLLFKRSLPEGLSLPGLTTDWHPPYTTATPEITQQRLARGDVALVLATDGVTGAMDNERVATCLTDRSRDRYGIAGRGLAARVLMGALDAYGHAHGSDMAQLFVAVEERHRRYVFDDVTVVVVDIDQAPLEMPQGRHGI